LGGRVAGGIVVVGLDPISHVGGEQPRNGNSQRDPKSAEDDLSTGVGEVRRAVAAVAVEVRVAAGEADGVFADEAAGAGVVPAGTVVVQTGETVQVAAGVEGANRAGQAAGDGRDTEGRVLDVLHTERAVDPMARQVAHRALVIGQRPDDSQRRGHRVDFLDGQRHVHARTVEPEAGVAVM